MSPDQEDLAPDDENQFDLETATLEQPLFGEIDWGGDGSDPHRPVRTHVLQALLPNNEAYPPPVAALLRLGDPRAADLTERRRAIDLTYKNMLHICCAWHAIGRSTQPTAIRSRSGRRCMP